MLYLTHMMELAYETCSIASGMWKNIRIAWRHASFGVRLQKCQIGDFIIKIILIYIHFNFQNPSFIFGPPLLSLMARKHRSSPLIIFQSVDIHAKWSTAKSKSTMRSLNPYGYDGLWSIEGGATGPCPPTVWARFSMFWGGRALSSSGRGWQWGRRISWWQRDEV